MSAVLAPVRVAEVLRVARLRGASDVHLACGRAPAFRVNGALETYPAAACSRDEMAALAAAFLESQQSRTRLAETGDVTACFREEQTGPVRVHAYRSHGGIALALRLLPLAVPNLESLRLPQVVATFAGYARGLIIFTGPTGSGKTTALAAIVDAINSAHAKHVITLEDPIEYVHASKRSIITQREVGSDVGSFADGISGALRSDPDVLQVGEMRDAGAIHAALTAAETGHLVLTTLHTGDAAQTIDRIVGAVTAEVQEQTRIQLAQTLAAIVCMRLVPCANGVGRRAACEILICTDAVRNLIRDGKSHHIPNVLSTSRRLGMQSLESHLTELAAAGEISALHAKNAAA